MNDERNQKPTPFVKWVGGKRSLIPELLKRLPSRFGVYYEPFVGGGALFFELSARLKAAFLSDVNLDLLLTYKVIRQDPEKLLELLSCHAENHSKEHYYAVRAQHELEEPVEIAARFIYLNKTCFNGLCRVNSKGEFNVPMGDYKNPAIVNAANIQACSNALRQAEIRLGTFDTIVPQPGDFVYFDPPYHPATESSFTKYAKGDFSEKDQIRLADFYTELHRRGVFVMLSNSDTAFVRGLYKKFKISTVEAPRTVNCKPEKRNAVTEVLITNYAYE